MKTSASKILKFWLNKLKLNKSGNYLNKQTILISIIGIIILTTFLYFLRPVFFDYNYNKKVFENKINAIFNLKMNIEGSISYKILPTPRFEVKNVNLNLIDSDKKKIRIKKLYILISSLSLDNFESIKPKKILVKKEQLEIHPTNFKKYFKYLTLKKENTLAIKNSVLFFIDDQGNKVIFNNTDYKEKFSENRHQVESTFTFAQNQINFKFLNRFGSEKYLKISIPKLKQSLDITFDKESNLDLLSGEIKLKFLETLLLLNFKGKEDFKISNSFLRNKFLNSKIDGKISFKDNFYFDFKLGINQIDLRKLLLYYPIFQSGGISKKINGKLDIFNKSTDSFFGNIKDSKMILIFENGDIKIKNFSAKILNNVDIKSNISILKNNKKPIIKFSINLFVKDSAKFFRKLGLYDFDKSSTSIFVNGNVDINSKKINIREVIKNNNERISKKEILIMEKTFNRYVLDQGVMGLFDFFKIKKFAQEIY